MIPPVPQWATPPLELARPLASRLLRALASPRRCPRSDRGAVLDPEIHRMLALSQPLMSDKPGPHEGYRAEIHRNSILAGPAWPKGLTQQHHVLAGRPATMFTPNGLQSVSEAPLVFFLHGGGFVVGSVKTHAAVCAALAVRARCRVLSFEYRLAPEHPWPAAPDDVFAAWKALVDSASDFGTSPEKIVISGDSAGGNLSVVNMLRCREHGIPLPRSAVLLYPGLDFTRTFQSHRTFSTGFFLSAQLIDWFISHYLTDP
ncbi:MAG: acetyl esterase/lipase, partial [Myxococcota bacterium]